MITKKPWIAIPISWPNVCDELMLEGPVMKSLGLFYVPDNIILQNGRIIARGLGVQQLRTKTWINDLNSIGWACAHP